MEQLLSCKVKVTHFSYVYRADGNVIPFINFGPAIAIDEDRVITKLPIACLDEKSDFKFSMNDELLITISSRDLPLVKVVSRVTDNHPTDLREPVCPICGAPLLNSSAQHSIGCCVNLACKAQTLNNCINLLASLGLYSQGQTLRVLTTCLNNGKLRDPVDVFLLDVKDIVTDLISDSQARAFIHYIHSVRGHATLEQVLRGLNIPGLTTDSIEKICLLFKARGYTLLDIDKLFDEEELEPIKDIDWTAWLDFISVADNKAIVKQLCTILHV